MQELINHQVDKICPDCWWYYVDTKSGVEKCWAGNGDHVGRHVIACKNYLKEEE